MEVRKINTGIKAKKLDETVYDGFISTLKQIKEGNQQLREEFISEYRPFILKVTSNAVGKYIDTRNSDEFSIAMSAFNEAIDKFDIGKGYNFFLFSEQVIKRRLIDYSRSNRDNKEYPFSFFDDEYFYNDEKLLSSSYIGFEDIEAREDIEELKNKLKEFGISFFDLVLNVPKHKDSRQLCIRIAKMLAEDEQMYKALMKNKSIPRNELKKKAKVHGRTIGNNRKYIIALCLIFKSNLNLSKRYLEYTMDGGK
ncbi:MAG TPA: RNA polymerase sigma-I factor [Acetivibrio sp.]|uniref:RNA polymerase sigma-I factor n=1 Tax=Acetivibrio sp. TaxID=1872092 RepID=UPI002BA7DDCF|nr:RNA polymerase sigma-I factor [Acetivibrio sp.]HOM03045.1 RNA polymerase sigma-I factor [Acetivibrio sp.]